MTSVFRAIMEDTSPPHVRAKIMAQQLDGALLGGAFDRLNSDGRCDLRALVWALDRLADDTRPAPVVTRARGGGGK